MTLRTRIEQRITDLRVERDIAAAALNAPNPWGNWRVMVRQFINSLAAEHIAAQDPATVIARIDRELAGCAADLALLDWPGWHHHLPAWSIVSRAMGIRYPLEESS